MCIIKNNVYLIFEWIKRNIHFCNNALVVFLYNHNQDQISFHLILNGFCVIIIVGVRDQPLDWQTAPPVHVLSYLVLGGKKDAMSKEVSCGMSINPILVLHNSV